MLLVAHALQARVLLLVVGLQMLLTGLLAEMVIYHQSAKAEYSVAGKLRKE